MEHIIARDFNITRDFKSIDWGATLWFNLMRAAGGGIVFAILGLLMEEYRRNTGVGTILAFPLIIPIGYLFFFLPMGMVCAFLAKFFPYVGILVFMLSLFVAAGDPLVWILSLVAPQAVPVAKPGFVNFALIMWVLKPEEAAEVVISEQRASKRL